MKSLKEAITLVIGMPMAMLAAAAATLGLALQWLGVSAVERLARR